jgi:hypothetical protein
MYDDDTKLPNPGGLVRDDISANGTERRLKGVQGDVVGSIESDIPRELR